MDIIVNGLFDLSKDKTYVIITEDRNEVGTLKIENGEYTVKTKNTDKPITFTDAQELRDWLGDEYVLATESYRWHEYNPNPLNNSKATDCTIRAYCAAEKLEWDEAYDIACKKGKETAWMPNDNKCVKDICENCFGYQYAKISKEQKGMTVKEFAIAHPEGTYLVEVPRHLVAVINGEYWDSWDCGTKKVKGWYHKD